VAALPNLIPAKTKVQTFGNVAYHFGDDAAPVLTVDVTRTGVYFEHNNLLWKHPAVTVTVRPPSGGYKPVVAGEQIYMAEARGPGMIAFSGDGFGRVVPVHMSLGRQIEVRGHQFLAATEGVEHTPTQQKGPPDLLHGGHTFTIDRFESPKGDGVLWIYAYGQVFEKDLEKGESIDIEPHAWIYKDTSMAMEPIVQRFTTGAFNGHASIVVNRFTGPGKVAVQSICRHRHDS
jgi:uncharacterized protein (AIM24 family)